jgi:CheY-like chemotaxis protein
MGGEIGVTSELGVGSTFEFTIPTTVHEAGVQEEPVLSDRASELAGVDVLVVDDNDAARLSLYDLLSSWGVAVSATGSSTQAEEWLEAGRGADVVLIDQRLGDQDGFSLARRLRAIQPEARIVLLSAAGRHPEAVPSGAVAGILDKPVRQLRLRELLCRLVGPEPETWPMQAAPRAEAAEPRPGHGPAVSPLRILLVEDNPNNQLVALGMLHAEGLDADVASNGQEALDALDARTYDLVMMDVHMPVMDGLETTRLILGRSYPEPRPRIVGVTANATDSSRAACLEAGMDDFLSKPIDRDRFRQVLRRLTRKVLVIEDDPANVEVLERVLARRPHVQVLTAATGTKGLEIAKSEQPDLILQDLHLPDMHGSEILACLRAEPGTAVTPVIVLSGSVQLEELEGVKEAGANHYLVKPYDFRELLALIDPYLGADGR